MNKDEDVIAAAKALMYLGVLGGPAFTALSMAVGSLAPKLIVKAVSLTRYPIIFQGQIVNYADPCGCCEISDCATYRLLYMPSLAYCPGCRTIHSAEPPLGELELA